MKVVGRTDVGKKRQNNEDSFFVGVEPLGGLPNMFIVADGMGGHKAGEVASRLSIDAYKNYIEQNYINDNDVLGYIEAGIKYANAEVHTKSMETLENGVMGTTFSGVAIIEDRVYCGHVGDSRIYTIKNGVLKLRSFDHSYVNELIHLGEMTEEEAKVHPNRNLITRAVGVSGSVNVDTFSFGIDEADYILICSDGLNGMVEDYAIEKILSNKNTTVENKAEDLVLDALENGGKDNITLILIEN